MNKKIILLGTIMGIITCLFPPFRVSFNTGSVGQGMHFIFASVLKDQASIDWNLLSVELFAISIATFGFAYCFNNKKK